ncbi:MAG: dipeptide/oligopeptide/nickel ABC transporter ATP-binding protein [Bacillota bacterium]
MIQVTDLKMSFKSELTGERQQVLKGLNFKVEQGDCLAILGESGSGKSTLGRILVGLLKPSSGEYTFLDQNPYKSRANRKFLSQNISIVFQDYNTSVNPRFTVTEIVAESINVLAKRSGIAVDKDAKVLEHLKTVGLDESFLDRFPHQLSGGQLQRVCIARAIAIEPKVIVFDEAISSLDAHTQVQIMDLLRELQSKFDLTYLFITHDLTAVTYLCNKVMFLYQGNITELIDVADIGSTDDPYAKKLVEVVIDV